MTDLLLSYGLVLLFVLVALESTGVPLPGETALITASILASQDHYAIEWVIAVAAAGAIVGDNAGYWIGRKGGRALLRRTPFIRTYFERVLPPAERFFERHGAKTVFFGRFVSLLRVTAAWLAGISHMPWWKFLFWNAAGGVVWATGYGTVAYAFGRAAADAITRYGLYAVGGIVVVVGIALLAIHLWRKRVFERR
ncbi:MAG TPA: DedA family protein [Gaiellaceae bacterium]|nr:DedA family protein [Gaiellaceae bacterium]